MKPGEACGGLGLGACMLVARNIRCAWIAKRCVTKAHGEQQNKTTKTKTPAQLLQSQSSVHRGVVVPAYRLESRSFSHPFFVRDRRSSRKGLWKRREGAGFRAHA
uniref:Uncharacterized protein n=1 Tax=Anopheles coluzzii TaxID=1518534 RepID=A0A8W7Q0M1_ANOCL